MCSRCSFAITCRVPQTVTKRFQNVLCNWAVAMCYIRLFMDPLKNVHLYGDQGFIRLSRWLRAAVKDLRRHDVLRAIP